MMKHINKLLFSLIILLLGCSGSMDYDETPKPVGGDSKIRTVFQQALGSAYDDVEGSNVVFTIRINENGVIEEVALKDRTNSDRVNRTVVFALKNNIRFTPAVKDGNKVNARFEYDFTF